jgi:hypothetical protein
MARSSKRQQRPTGDTISGLAGGAVGFITNSWATRVRRDDRTVVQIDGTVGSAWRFHYFTQPAVNTPEVFFGAARSSGMDFATCWQEAPDMMPTANPFRQCRGAYLRHVAEDAPDAGGGRHGGAVG